jgi:nitronate monooxygenase
MRNAAKTAGDAERMQMWAGQSAKLATSEPAGEIVRRVWEGSVRLLKDAGQL